jgi:hypothetical protein
MNWLREEDIEEVARRIQDNHPPIDQILSAYRESHGIRARFREGEAPCFISAKEELHVVHTPEFRRHFKFLRRILISLAERFPIKSAITM